MRLDTARRATLIAEVNSLVERVRQQAHTGEEARKVLDMTHFALVYLQRHTPDALRALLNVPHATTTVQGYWQDFAAYLRPTLDWVQATYPDPESYREALLYLLGWLHRVRRGPAGDRRSSSQTMRRTEAQPSWPVRPRRSVEDRPQSRPTISGEPPRTLGDLLNQPATPPPVPRSTYNQGDSVQVTVVTGGFNGVVRLPDGMEIRSVNLYGMREGATITVRIVDVAGDGRVRRVVR
jgi:hypothetical protein